MSTSASFLSTIAAASAAVLMKSKSPFEEDRKPIQPFCTPELIGFRQIPFVPMGHDGLLSDASRTVPVLEADGRWTKSPAEIPDIARQVWDMHYPPTTAARGL